MSYGATGTITVKLDGQAYVPGTMVLHSGSSATVEFIGAGFDDVIGWGLWGGASAIVYRSSVSISVLQDGWEDPDSANPASDGPKPVIFRIERGGYQGIPFPELDVFLAEPGGSADETIDFDDSIPRSVKFEEGDSVIDITITPKDDDIVEFPETLELEVIKPSSALYILAAQVEERKGAGKLRDNDYELKGARVEFYDQGVLKDEGEFEMYAAPQWRDDNNDGKHDDAAAWAPALGYPISFVRGTPAVANTPAAPEKVGLRAEFLIVYKDEKALLADFEIEGLGKGPGAGNFGGFAVQQVVDGPNRIATVSGTYSSTSTLPETIKTGELEIGWKIRRMAPVADNPPKVVGVTEYGASKNHIYVTGVAGLARETVLDLGCRGADGKRPRNPGEVTVFNEDANGNGALDTNEDANGNGVLELGEDTVVRNGTLDAGEDANGNGVLDPVYDPAVQDRAVVDGIWGEFRGNDTKRVDRKTMKYAHEGDFGVTFAELLSKGAGQCTAWAELLVETLRVQGVQASSTRIISVRPDPFPAPADSNGVPEAGFTVVEGPAQGSGGQNYGDRTFTFHQVVKIGVYPSRVYDPSYGGTPAEGSSPTDAEAVYESLRVFSFWFEYRDVNGVLVGGSIGVPNTAAKEVAFR
jgi:hypothetical protein